MGRIFFFLGGGQEKMMMISARMCGDGEEFISPCSSVVRDIICHLHCVQNVAVIIA